MWYPNPRKAQLTLKRSPAKGRTIEITEGGGGGCAKFSVHPAAHLPAGFFFRHKFCTNLFFHTLLLLELIYDLRKIYIVISKITKIEARSDWPRGVFA